MIELRGIRVSPENDTSEQLRIAAAHKLRVDTDAILRMTPFRRSVDARRKDAVQIDYTLRMEIPGMEERILRRVSNAVRCTVDSTPQCIPGSKKILGRPVVVGLGPAGLFAGLTLAKAGYRPIVLERGAPIHERIQKVNVYFGGGPLDAKGNITFGEGGAGTFSDGKLTTRIKDPLCREILESFIAEGADPDILYQQRAHVGTDVLRTLFPRLRQQLIDMDGEVRFYTCADKLQIRDGNLTALLLSDGSVLETNAVIWATGHSARDSYRMLADMLPLEAKPSAMGVRIEHSQAWLDTSQYGRYAGHPALGAADYHLQVTVDGRSVYSFCMCPGGTVVNASHEPEQICVNGMSSHARDGLQCNAAIVVQVNPADYGEGALAGLVYQERMEHAAYLAGDGLPPAQRLEDFLTHRITKQFGCILPTVLPGTGKADLHKVLPESIGSSLVKAIPLMDQRLHGFATPDAVLTGVETRTSSPVRIPRSADGCAIGLEGFYPAGEGAGYAGGIMSSAVDGIHAARHLISAFRKP